MNASTFRHIVRVLNSLKNCLGLKYSTSDFFLEGPRGCEVVVRIWKEIGHELNKLPRHAVHAIPLVGSVDCTAFKRTNTMSIDVSPSSVLFRPLLNEIEPARANCPYLFSSKVSGKTKKFHA